MLDSTRFLRVAPVLLAIGVALALIGAPTVAAQAAGWQAGPGAQGDNTYGGFIDAPTSGAVVPSAGSFLVRGWFVDQTAQGWAGADDVEIWLGAMDGGGHLLAKALFGQPRPDVAAALNNPQWVNSGFLATVPGASVPGGPQTLYVYAHTPDKGWWFKTVNVNGGGSLASGANPGAADVAAAGVPQISFITPYETQNVSTHTTNFVISGEVSDATNTTVEVWIDGEKNTQYGVFVGNATPSSDGSWAVNWNPSHFRTGHANLYAYAMDRATGLTGEAMVGFNVVSH
jgi:hypothetical protein